MKKRIAKQLLTLALCATMVVTNLVAQTRFVFAEENEETPQEVEIQSESNEESASQEASLTGETLDEDSISEVEEMSTTDETPMSELEETDISIVEEPVMPEVEETTIPEITDVPVLENLYEDYAEKIPQQASYLVYWLDSCGNAIRNFETRTACVGDYVQIQDSDKYVDGYTFDSENPCNILETVISSEDSAPVL